MIDRVGPNNGYVLGIDRSPAAIRKAVKLARDDIFDGRLAYRRESIEKFILQPGDQRFDLAVAINVGTLDGRYPEAGALALARIKAALVPDGQLLIDGGDPLRALTLPR